MTQEIEKLADQATREIHGDDYRLTTRLIIEEAIEDALAAQQGRVEMVLAAWRYRNKQTGVTTMSFQPPDRVSDIGQFEVTELFARDPLAAKLAQPTEPAAQAQSEGRKVLGSGANAGSSPAPSGAPASAAPAGDLELPEDIERLLVELDDGPDTVIGGAESLQSRSRKVIRAILSLARSQFTKAAKLAQPTEPAAQAKQYRDVGFGPLVTVHAGDDLELPPEPQVQSMGLLPNWVREYVYYGIALRSLTRKLKERLAEAERRAGKD